MMELSRGCLLHMHDINYEAMIGLVFIGVQLAQNSTSRNKRNVAVSLCGFFPRVLLHDSARGDCRAPHRRDRNWRAMIWCVHLVRIFVVLLMIFAKQHARNPIIRFTPVNR